MSSHVLGRFASEEKNVVEAMVIDAASAVELAIDEGLGVAMNRYNQKPKKKKAPKPEPAPDVDSAGSGREEVKGESNGEGNPPLQSGSEDAINTDPI